jgi:glycosyltransferase involved in cell wall biosynthesis
MTTNYLLGPLPSDQAHRWRGDRDAGHCIAFNVHSDLDLTIDLTDSWEDICRRLPAGWRPDFIALNLGYRAIPPGLWSAPVPLVGLAIDWNLLWHQYRRALRRCELVLTDLPGVDLLGREGFRHVRPANLFGCDASWLDGPWPDGPRDIDMLFVGNLQPAVQRERLSWLGRLSRLAGRWKVVIATGIFGEEYRSLMGRARIVFNRSIRGECNMRAMEAAAAGALLFQEADNCEVAAYFRHRHECIRYDDDNLEARLEHYLTHEEERRAIADAARECVRNWSFPALWQRALAAVTKDWPELTQRAADRSQPDAEEQLLGRVWEALSCADGGDPRLVEDLEHAVVVRPGSAALYNALALARALRGPSPANIVDDFGRAIAAEPLHVVAALNRAAVLINLGDREAATHVAREALRVLDRSETLPPAVLDAPSYPPGFDTMRVEWERAAWENAGKPMSEARAKHDLLRWRAHSLLADMTGDLAHYREAALARPDLAATRAALGCALGRAGRPAEAVPHFRRALTNNPFDNQAARALYQALSETGDCVGQDRLAADRRLLATAALGIVPVEPWFEETTNGQSAVSDEATPPADSVGGPPARFQTLTLDEFHHRYGNTDSSRAIHSFTPPQDTHVVVALLAHACPRRVLEIGTASGHMTANLSAWTPDEATIFTLGTTAELGVPTTPQQRYEDPPRAAFGRHAGHFGKAHKVQFITADSLSYHFDQLGLLDFVFIDGAHDFEHVQSDTLKAYQQLSPGGYLVWHDYESLVDWVEVRPALEAIDFAETVVHVAGTGVAFLQKGIGVRAPQVVSTLDKRREVISAPPACDRPLAIVWEGVQDEVQSLAPVNRQFCRRLIERGHEVSLRPLNFPAELGVPKLPAPPELAARFGTPLGRSCDVHVRHAWPPDFTPPPAGHFVLIQPWEYGSLPRAWVQPFLEQVDEVWAYTHAVRDCYIESGIPADRVHVVPLGVDVERFRPGLAPFPLKTQRRFKFLFVGGTIRRKGFDVLLAAYTQAFTAADDVCLVVKDMGAGSFYRGQTAEGEVARLRATPGAPEIEYLNQSLTEGDLARLYAACDCLVLPYRGEGFGLPIAEAMACGLSVVVTGLGAALDYCDDSRAYLIPAEKRALAEERVGDWPTVGPPWLAEPDGEALAAMLRHIAAHPEEARAKGAAASAFVRAHLTWEHAADRMEIRLKQLRRRPVRRHSVAVKRRMRVSLCMIVKNEEHNLPDCLVSVGDLVDEIILVDTGSTDRTKEVARQFRARVFDFAWVDSFAAARNESLRHATGDFVFWMDADDRLDADNRARLRSLFRGLPDANVAFVMKCLCLPDPETRTATVVDHVRLFRNDPELRWEYRVHEQILPALRRRGADVRWSDVVIRHAGYQDPALRRRKLQRDLRLLHLERAEKPEDPFVLFNLGSIAQELGQFREAVSFLQRSLELSHPRDSIVRKLYALLAQCHRHLGQNGLALAACRKGRECYPDDVELLFQEGLALRERGERTGARACWLALLQPQRHDHFASVDTGLTGYKVRHNLAQIELEEGRLAEAERHWRAALAEQPGFVPARVGLAEVQARRIQSRARGA